MMALKDSLETGRTDGVATAREDFGKAIRGVEASDTDGAVEEFGLHWECL